MNIKLFYNDLNSFSPFYFMKGHTMNMVLIDKSKT